MEILDIILVTLLIAGALFFLIKKSIGKNSCGTGCGCDKKKSGK